MCHKNCVRAVVVKDEHGKGIPCAYCWSKQEGVKFHEEGKKAPEGMLFRPKCGKVPVAIPQGVDNLKLGPVRIPIVDRQRV